MTIKEIAKMAGVSVSAVSRYLNDGYISEEKRRSIKEVIEKTGYQPSKQAQILRTKKSKVVGVILPKISSESIGRMADGISSVLSKQGYQMLLACTENSPAKEIEYLELLNKNPVDGILFSASVFDTVHQKALKKLEVPIVIISQKFEGYACVYHDDFGAARDVTKQLLDSGRKQLGYIAVTQEDRAAGYSRTKGYEAALAAYGRKLDRNRTVETGFTLDDGYDSMKELLKKFPDIDAVFCATDTLAIGAISCLQDMGKRVPEDISIAGVGHNKISRVMKPRLTTAHLHYKTSGIEAANMLLEMIENDVDISKQVQLGYEIIQAESVIGDGGK